MLTIDTSDCWLEIGVGRKFICSLVWHFSRFLRENLSARRGLVALDTGAVDAEARRLAFRFIADMQETFRSTLGDAYEHLENLGAEGVVDLYLQENLEDFKADYLNERFQNFGAGGPQSVLVPASAGVVEAVCV